MNDFEKLKELDAFHLNLELYSAAENGDLDLVRYVLTEIKKDVSSVEYAFTSACGGNQVEIVNYLLYSDKLKHHPDINTEKYSSFLIACEQSLEVVKILIPLLNFKDDEQREYVADNAIFKACEGGNLELVKYLLTEKIVTDYFNVSEKIDDLISTAGSKGHIDVFEYLLNLDKNKILNSDVLDNIILNCFIDSRFEMIEYLMNHKELNVYIDLNSDDDFLFNFLCEQGGSYEIEYLVKELKIDKTEKISEILSNPEYKEYNKFFEKRDLNDSLSKELEDNEGKIKRPKI